MPRPMPSTPALLDTTVRFFTPDSRIATISVSGMPHRPKPPAMTIMPSLRRPASAAVASEYTFFMQRTLPQPRGMIPKSSHWISEKITLGQQGTRSVAEVGSTDQARRRTDSGGIAGMRDMPAICATGGPGCDVQPGSRPLDFFTALAAAELRNARKALAAAASL